MADNPKQAAGDAKDPLGLVPRSVLHHMARVLRNGAAKYGPWNWRDKPIETLTYVHATMRHLTAYGDGEDTDPESGLPHLAHALASLAVLVDGIEHGAKDTRPGKAPTALEPLPCPGCLCAPLVETLDRLPVYYRVACATRGPRCHIGGAATDAQAAIRLWNGFVAIKTPAAPRCHPHDHKPGCANTPTPVAPAPAPLPCPKCKRPPTQHVGRAGTHTVRCDHCMYAGGFYVDRENAIAAWDTFVRRYQDDHAIACPVCPKCKTLPTLRAVGGGWRVWCLTCFRGMDNRAHLDQALAFAAWRERVTYS